MYVAATASTAAASLRPLTAQHRCSVVPTRPPPSARAAAASLAPTPRWHVRTIRPRLTSAAAASPSSSPVPGGTLSAPAFVGGAALAIGGALAWQAGWVGALKAALDASALGTSGALAAFSLVFLSELGDKTFFLAGLLAMRVGRSAALVGSVAALGAMTLISVAIGAAFQAVPSAVSSSVNISKWASVACLVYFGLKTLKGAADTPPGPAMVGGSGGGGGGAVSAATADNAATELAAAQEELDEAARAGRVHDTVGGAAAASSPPGALRAWSRAATEVGSIIFLAEWGDRSMLATIALAAAQSPAGVAAGAVAGHAVATAIAVWGGVLAARHLSERTIGLIGGCLFLVFAAATLAGWM